MYSYFFSLQMMMPTLLLFIDSIGGKAEFVGLCSVIAMISSLIIRPFAGIALDSFGRRGIYFIGLVIIVVTTLLYSWSPILWLIFDIRFINGFGWGVTTTASTTIAADIIPFERYGDGVGFFTMPQCLKLALAPIAGIAVMNKVVLCQVKLQKESISIPVARQPLKWVAIYCPVSNTLESREESIESICSAICKH